jgi:Flp pilus assembly protein TadB
MSLREVLVVGMIVTIIVIATILLPRYLRRNRDQRRR